MKQLLKFICTRGWLLYLLGALVALVLVSQYRLNFRILDVTQAGAYHLVNSYNTMTNPAQVRRAIIYYKTLSKIWPLWPEEVQAIGYGYYLLKEYHKAAIYFEKAKKMGLADFGIDFNLGMTYFALGQYAKSKKSIEDSLAQLSLETYYQPQRLSPYQSFIDQHFSPTVEGRIVALRVVLEHQQQLLYLIDKILNKKVTVQELENKKQWDVFLLNSQVFYIVPKSRKPSS